MSTAAAAANVKKSKSDDPEHSAKAMRETIESIVIAIILAFLFRTFEAEAFVIPTGSMAPTLQGRHKDVECPQCAYRYRTGASDEEKSAKAVVGTVCPICRYTHVVDPIRDPNEDSFTGDRILVSKFAYQIGEPERWDPIVFKFPGNAKQNYIKRLIGLPEETVNIYQGDIFLTGPGEQAERIARKPPHKLVGMLHLVDDTNYLAPKLVEQKWPSRWQRWAMPTADKAAEWTMTVDGKSFSTTGQGDVTWLRYKHVPPLESDWDALRAGQLPADLAGLSAEEITAQRDRLISDFYAYNEHFLLYADQFKKLERDLPEAEFAPEVRKRWTADDSPTPEGVLGKHWVGDLGLECEATVSSEQGELLLDLVEGGSHYSCRIDVATGLAQLSIDDGKTEFVGENGEKAQFPQAQTALRGSGSYRLRLTNCDDQMLLWVNGRVASFNGPTTYANRANCVPQWSATDPGDLAPAGIGSKGAALMVRGLRIFRDVYYIASEGNPNDDYDLDYNARSNFETEIIRVFNDPQTWKSTTLFGARRHVSVALGKDQFFPLGDNSPESADARSWNADPFVKREMLIGKALLIYWPHAWNRPVPFTPNIERMGVIH